MKLTPGRDPSVEKRWSSALCRLKVKYLQLRRDQPFLASSKGDVKNETIPEKVFEEVCRKITFAFPEGCSSLTPRENGGQKISF